MAFPTTSVIDNFNRSNTGPPPSASWDYPVASGEGGLKVVSNALAPNASGAPCSSYWKTAFGAPCEVYATITNNAGTFELYCRLSDVETSTQDGYGIYIDPANGIVIFKIVNGTYTQLGDAVSATISNGHKYGLTAIGTTLTLWRDTGSGWSSVTTRTDSSITAGGYIGALIYSAAGTARLDDFGGGTVTATATLSATLAATTLSATAEVEAAGVEASLDATLTSTTLSSTATVDVSATASMTLADTTLTSTVEVEIAGAASITLADATLTSAATVQVDAALTATLDDVSLSSTATVDIAAGLAVTIADTSLTATATVDIIAALASALADVVLQSAAETEITAQSAVTLADVVLQSTATVDIEAAASITLAETSLVSTATVADEDEITASLAVTLADVTLAATAGVEVAGAANITIADITLTASATVEIEAQAAITLQGVSLSATAEIEINAAATITLADTILTAACQVTGAIDVVSVNLPARSFRLSLMARSKIVTLPQRSFFVVAASARTGVIMDNRRVLEDVAQGANETIPYSFSTTPWGITSPTVSSITAYQIDPESGAETDVSATVLSGSATVEGAVITLPLLAALIFGYAYRVDVLITDGETELEAQLPVTVN